MVLLDVGPRIKLARSMNDMSQRTLAERAGVSATAVSKFERGLSEPRLGTLMRIAQALSMEISFFLQESRVQKIVPACRLRSRLGPKARRRLEAVIVHAVEKRLSIEGVFPAGFIPGCDLPRCAITRLEDAEWAAETVRRRWKWGGGPLPDLVGRLEDSGIRVVAVGDVEGFCGFSCWINGEDPVIAFNRGVPADRQRFGLSRAVGHLVLQSGEHDLLQTAANRFAAALLVPREAALSKLGSRRKNLSLEELLLLKQEYGVSLQSWVRRARDLNIIGAAPYDALLRRLTSLSWRTDEPGEIPPEKPRRLHLLVHQALAEDLITDSQAARILGHPPRRVPADSSGGHSSDPAGPAIYEGDEELTFLNDADREEEPDE